MNSLAEKTCVPCQGDIPPLMGYKLINLFEQLTNDWALVNSHHIEKEYKFNNFQQALEFTNRIGAIAEEQNHHPDIHLSWGKVKIIIWTHKIDGLTESDFIFAAKTDDVLHKVN
ncbi:MAG: 4a-hydroxytetrahydrobiopterin dehydratase [Saccharospirillaceae bacterium]|nr:4a-hydroxytetrahydrobiopterin dehydratase [Pseudomonadales bacterium]NRB78905.1 4a-hydroxytetrahydrobiopterin dehydratase [Saccharospirillaceae bacterium]